jgi:hypothetical protein
MQHDFLYLLVKDKSLLLLALWHFLLGRRVRLGGVLL